MLLIALLVLALAFLVVGLVLANGIWLVASLVTSAIAGYVLWKQREQSAAKSGVHKDSQTGTAAPKTSSRPKQESLVTGTAFVGPAPGSQSAPANPEQAVWVVDGLPQFHAEKCAAILNLNGEAVPLSQALEDGFTECAVCKPLPSANAAEQVWVVDGRPDYHLADCRSLKIAATHHEKEPEQIPRAQAVEDGFSPCPDCRPDGAAPADAGDKTPSAAAATPSAGSRPSPTEAATEAPQSEQPAAQQSGTVWVVDGRPRYHLADCLIIKDQQAEEIPLAQATEDGFMACSMCEPNVQRSNPSVVS